MKKAFALKSCGLFDPASEKPFKISRPGIELFLECPRWAPFSTKVRAGGMQRQFKKFFIQLAGCKTVAIEHGVQLTLNGATPISRVH